MNKIGKVERMNQFKVLSFDPERIKSVKYGRRIIAVAKKTSEHELRHMLQAHRYILLRPIALRNRTIVLTPAHIIDWSRKNNVLLTEYCRGLNLEHALKTRKKIERMQWVHLFREFFSQLRSTGFLWGDCAPRNMIFDGKLNSIRIVDFERKLIFKRTRVTTSFFTRYLRNYAYEEFSCFLFKDEQEILFRDFLTPEPNRNIKTSSIESNRKRILLRLCFGQKDYYRISELREVEDLMVSIATPFFIGRTPFYPMELIDRITTKGGTTAYVQVVRKIKNLTNKERAQELENIAKTFL